MGFFNLQGFMDMFGERVREGMAKSDMPISALSTSTKIYREKISQDLAYDGEFHPRVGEMVKILEAVDIDPKSFFKTLSK